MNREAITTKIKSAEKELAFWRRLEQAGCKDCEHFEGRVCRLAGGVAPPAEVLPIGCPEWVWDGVPF